MMMIFDGSPHPLSDVTGPIWFAYLFVGGQAVGAFAILAYHWWQLSKRRY
jgi:hypothetical protein